MSRDKSPHRHNGSDSEDEGDFFGFQPGDEEWEQVAKLMTVFAEENDVEEGVGLKAEEGERLAAKFQKYVEKYHDDVADSVKRDRDIYEEILRDWCD